MNKTDRILAFIRQFTEVMEYPPTRRDIMDGCNISSTSVVQHHLAKLRDAGKIEVLPGLARGIKVRDDEVQISEIMR